MATNFPTSLDSLTNPTASDKLNSVTVPHASQHATLNDAVEALEAKVGVDGSAVTTSHDYLIDKQSVVPYDDASARTTAVPSPIEGQMSYLKDTNSVEVYDGSAWAAVGGKILQVVSTTKTDTFSTSSTSLTDITGLSVAITPSATSSKILIILSLSQIGMNADNWFFGDVTRAGTPIGVGDSAGSRTPSSWAASTTGANRPDNCNWHFLDSPNTTSATTYQARVRVAGNTVYINRHSVDTDSPGYPRSVSSITALEVSA